jgi:hypothetical protein
MAIQAYSLVPMEVSKDSGRHHQIPKEYKARTTFPIKISTMQRTVPYKQ